MAEIKTKPTEVSVSDFLDKIDKEQLRDDCRTLLKLFKKVTGFPPKMWGPTIVGFGKYHYKYDSGHEGDMCITGFAPRQDKMVLYVGGFPEFESLLKKLGKHKVSKACLYIKKLDDVDLDVVEQIVKKSVACVQKKYPHK